MSRHLDSAPAGSDAYRVQFLHPEKSLGIFTPATPHPRLTAEITGVDEDDVLAVREAFVDNVAGHARGILAEHPGLAATAKRAIPTGTRIAALGDSITDDLQSWAYLLDELLRIVHETDGLFVANFGRAGDTTVDLRGRLQTVLDHCADLVVVQVGTNDAKGVLRGDAAPLVSAMETGRNAALIDAAIAAGGARRVWVLPSTPNFARLARCQWFVGMDLAWDPASIEATRAALRSAVWAEVDQDEVLAGGDHLLDDGLHPDAHGQTLIAIAVIRHLADRT